MMFGGNNKIELIANLKLQYVDYTKAPRSMKSQREGDEALI
jgi:hypothetical protein